MWITIYPYASRIAFIWSGILTASTMKTACGSACGFDAARRDTSFRSASLTHCPFVSRSSRSPNSCIARRSASSSRRNVLAASSRIVSFVFSRYTSSNSVRRRSTSVVLPDATLPDSNTIFLGIESLLSDKPVDTLRDVEQRHLSPCGGPLVRQIVDGQVEPRRTKSLLQDSLDN